MYGGGERGKGEKWMEECENKKQKQKPVYYSKKVMWKNYFL